MPRVTELTINGRNRRIDADGERMLLYVLREDLEMTGTKYGCGEGPCGACTVLVDGEATRSCRLPVRMAAGRKITTIEGLAPENGPLHPVQQAFLDADALQCGYCTSGMIMGAVGLLRNEPNPSNSIIQQKLSGNICRCGTYPRIVEAVRLAARSMTSEAKGGRNA